MSWQIPAPTSGRVNAPGASGSAAPPPGHGPGRPLPPLRPVLQPAARPYHLQPAPQPSSPYQHDLGSPWGGPGSPDPGWGAPQPGWSPPVTPTHGQKGGGWGFGDYGGGGGWDSAGPGGGWGQDFGPWGPPGKGSKGGEKGGKDWEKGGKGWAYEEEKGGKGWACGSDMPPPGAGRVPPPPRKSPATPNGSPLPRGAAKSAPAASGGEVWEGYVSGLPMNCSEEAVQEVIERAAGTEPLVSVRLLHKRNAFARFRSMACLARAMQTGQEERLRLEGDRGFVGVQMSWRSSQSPVVRFDLQAGPGAGPYARAWPDAAELTRWLGFPVEPWGGYRGGKEGVIHCPTAAAARDFMRRFHRRNVPDHPLVLDLKPGDRDQPPGSGDSGGTGLPAMSRHKNAAGLQALLTQSGFQDDIVVAPPLEDSEDEAVPAAAGGAAAGGPRAAGAPAPAAAGGLDEWLPAGHPEATPSHEICPVPVWLRSEHKEIINDPVKEKNMMHPPDHMLNELRRCRKNNKWYPKAAFLKRPNGEQQWEQAERSAEADLRSPAKEEQRKRKASPEDSGRKPLEEWTGEDPETLTVSPAKRQRGAGRGAPVKRQRTLVTNRWGACIEISPEMQKCIDRFQIEEKDIRITTPEVYQSAYLFTGKRWDPENAFDPCPWPVPDDFNGLKCDWSQWAAPKGGRIYLNPPFTQMGLWMRKALREVRKGVEVLALVSCPPKWKQQSVGSWAGGAWVRSTEAAKCLEHYQSCGLQKAAFAHPLGDDQMPPARIDCLLVWLDPAVKAPPIANES
eukprot:TRINITY_DN2663_c2_g1_i3.p1 TRINITY_DN2663_c2_g1~~TRINITY_DN2663_c2_g1_i3.p1  ORF type:complete len:787 (+),score=173.03 TRINITY_DN2663_c2_g1_i3:85-2445(+)